MSTTARYALGMVFILLAIKGGLEYYHDNYTDHSFTDHSVLSSEVRFYEKK